MNEGDATQLIRSLPTAIFTTRDFSAVGKISAAFASQMLGRLAVKGSVTRLFRGFWADTRHPRFTPFAVVAMITQPHPAAISLLTALHLHGMIEQIPQVIYAVSTGPTRKITTPVGHYSIHQIAPDFFVGYEYDKSENFLIATPEKALVDTLYLSTRKGNRFASLPELSLPKNFSKRRTLEWIKKINSHRLRSAVARRFEALGHLSK